MTPQQFIAKWQQTSLSERSAYQQHFLDLCEVLGVEKPADADPAGTWYTFEYGVQKTTGGHGWADVWKRGFFGWEYKGKHKNLKAAYDQLLQYREALENPFLLVVCDLDRFEVHTNFPNTVKQVYAFDLAGLAEPQNFDVLRKVFTDPQALKPGETPETVTEQVAELFGQIADALRARNVPPSDAAHFLMKLMFCMFAEDIELLTGKEKLFSRVLKSAKNDPQRLAKSLRELFEAMCGGGDFWGEDVLYFNGGLFADADVIELQPGEIQKLVDANIPDWGNVEPSVFGTLFERTLDPDKRSQIGAHYTSRADIETLLEPVVMQPLRCQWQSVKEQCEALLPAIREAARKQAAPQLPGRKAAKPAKKRKESKARQEFDKLLHGYHERLSHVTILDPACGSGNFLYVALHLLLDLEKEVISYAARQGVGLLPHVRPTQLAGIEINPYAQELASVVIWIGYLQWMRHNGFNPPNNPVLEPIETIRRMDAILDLSDPEHPLEPEWPEAEFIVGNPPFLGGKRILSELGPEYTAAMRAVWDTRLPRFSDLCCYWFEKARQQIERNRALRAGLLATQGIRGEANRTVLNRIKDTGDIFFAESDRDWILDGATVHVSMVGFDAGNEQQRVLDGQPVAAIHSNLSVGANVTEAVALKDNANRGFIGVQKSGSFDVTFDKAVALLKAPTPSGLPVSDVMRVYWTAIDMVRRPTDTFIIDFVRMDQACAAKYEAAFEYVREHVPRDRSARHFQAYPVWQLWRPRPEMYAAIADLSRFLVTPHVAKHRLFAWAEPCVCPSNLLICVATENDWEFGVLQSKAHEHWALAMGTQLRERESGFRYTPTTCFETFPFPDRPTDAQREAIAAAARELDELRQRWLNPPEWTRTEVLEFPGSADGPWKRYIDNAGRPSKADQTPDHPASTRPALEGRPTSAIGTVRYPRIVAKDEECAKQLKKRTLTNLYNERPTWLDLAHRKLDEAVFAAYGWDAGMRDEELLGRLLELNLERAGR